MQRWFMNLCLPADQRRRLRFRDGCLLTLVDRRQIVTTSIICY